MSFVFSFLCENLSLVQNIITIWFQGLNYSYNVSDRRMWCRTSMTTWRRDDSRRCGRRRMWMTMIGGRRWGKEYHTHTQQMISQTYSSWWELENLSTEHTMKMSITKQWRFSQTMIWDQLLTLQIQIKNQRHMMVPCTVMIWLADDDDIIFLLVVLMQPSPGLYSI